jgi:hypothetical protein
MTPEQRFEKQLIPEPNTGCWVWLGFINQGGYGRFFYQGKMYSAHRISYLFFKGHIPDGLFVCHSCDNRWCVNPDHLWLGTRTDNTNDMWAKGRHLVKKRKLSFKIACDIREGKYAGMTQKQIADMFGTTQVCISQVILGKTWYRG